MPAEPTRSVFSACHCADNQSRTASDTRRAKRLVRLPQAQPLDGVGLGAWRPGRRPERALRLGNRPRPWHTWGDRSGSHREQPHLARSRGAQAHILRHFDRTTPLNTRPRHGANGRLHRPSTEAKSYRSRLWTLPRSISTSRLPVLPDAKADGSRQFPAAGGSSTSGSTIRSRRRSTGRGSLEVSRK